MLDNSIKNSYTTLKFKRIIDLYGHVKGQLEISWVIVYY
jgi:hypothetical protein